MMKSSTPIVVGLALLACGLCFCNRPAAGQPDGAAVAGQTDGPNYTIEHAPVTLAVEADGQIVLHVTPATGFKINVEYPWHLTVSTDTSLTVTQAEWDRQSARKVSEDEVLYEIPVQATAPGDHAVAGHLAFSVCNEARCDVVQADVTWTVTAE